MDDEFLEELRKLLNKYDASILYEFSFGADTHGLCDSGMAIEIGNKVIWREPYSAMITASDL